MGYSYDYRGRLCCDACGKSGGVRRRTCPHKVLGNSLRTQQRVALPACSAPALCKECYAKHGGQKGLHDGCAEFAAKSQAEDDAIEAALDAGEKFVVSASGDWLDHVPKDHVEVTFWGRHASGEVKLIVPKNDYDYNNKRKLSDYSEYITT